MAKYLVTNGSAFTPFTYDELVAPLKDMATAHSAAQDAYDTLSTETALLERYITDNPGDQKAKKMYNDYMTKLTSLQENLWNNGFTTRTRQDLSAARTGYTRDISRIATAVKNRQERSAAYHKIKSEHPDMVMGEDPGLSGLDAYIDNDLFGQDYFTYSGKSFADEVGAEVKAMGNEMLQDPKISKDPRLVGYIQQKLTEGFSNQEADNAMSFIRGILGVKKEGMTTGQLLDMAQSALDNGGGKYGLSTAEKLLAGALISRLRSTGAADNVSDREFNRLVDYGEIGVKYGVGKSTLTNLTDHEWAERQKINLENLRHTHALAEAAAKNGSPTDATDRGYEIPSFYLRTQGADADKKTKLYGDYFGKVSKENPLNVKINGEWKKAETPEEATNLLYNNEYHTNALDEYGFDTSKPATKKQEHQIEYEFADHSKQTFNIRSRHDSGDRVIVEVQRPDGKWERWDEATEKYNAYRQNDKAYRDKIEKDNGIKFSDYDNSPKDEEKFRDEFDINDPTGKLRPYYRSIAEIKTMLGQEKPAMLVGPTNKDVLNDYSAEISNAFSANPPLGKKDNHFAFYRLGPDLKINEKNKESFDKVFNLDDEKNIKGGSLKSISATPRLLAQGYLIVSTSNGLFAMDAHMLDTALGSALYGSSTNPVGLVGIVGELMSPFEKPEDTFRMNDLQDKQFTDFTMSIFDPNYEKDTYVPNTRKMMDDADARNDYYAHIVDLIHATFAQPREVLELLNFQVRGNSSTKAATMFPRQ